MTVLRRPSQAVPTTASKHTGQVSAGLEGQFLARQAVWEHGGTSATARIQVHRDLRFECQQKKRRTSRIKVRRRHDTGRCKAPTPTKLTQVGSSTVPVKHNSTDVSIIISPPWGAYGVKPPPTHSTNQATDLGELHFNEVQQPPPPWPTWALATRPGTFGLHQGHGPATGARSSELRQQSTLRKGQEGSAPNITC